MQAGLRTPGHLDIPDADLAAIARRIEQSLPEV
jgi:hypothetical protein